MSEIQDRIKKFESIKDARQKMSMRWICRAGEAQYIAIKLERTLEQLAKEHPEWKIEFLGYSYDGLMDELPPVQHAKSPFKKVMDLPPDKPEEL